MTIEKSKKTKFYFSIVQALNYKDSLQKNYYALKQESDKTLQVFNPKCMVIIGKTVNGLNEEQKASFELYRNDSRQVEVVTFDELFQKVQMLADLLEGKNE